MIRIAFAGATLALAGCSGSAVTQLAVFDGDVITVGPKGYCADVVASRPDSGFAIFAPCATLGVRSAAAVASAIATVQVGESGSAIVQSDPAGFAAVLAEASGPSILARGSDATTVTINMVIQDGARVSVYFTDDSETAIEGMQNAEWRSFVDLNDRLVTVSVRGIDAAPLSEHDGVVLLDQAVNGLIAVNTPTDG
jgi:hypothetical protein